ncbi:MAG: hypothetical protein AAFP03_12165, partial [Cyanobacteria bacterium J06598_3]
MRLSPFSQPLWTVGVLGLSGLWMGPAAIANPPQSSTHPAETIAQSAPPDVSALTHRDGHDCFDLDIEQSEPLGEFREALLESAAIAARNAAEPVQQLQSLLNLSDAYACLGQMDRASALATEVLILNETFVPDGEIALFWVELASFYREQLDDEGQAEALLSQAITLAETLTDAPVVKHMLLGEIAGQ